MSSTKFNKSLAQIRVAIDVVVFTIEQDKLKTLLVKRVQEPFPNRLALPGGFIWESERSIDTAKRILRDKTGVEGVFIEQLFTFDEVDRDPRGRVLSITYYALVSADKLTQSNISLAKQAILQDVDSIKDLAFDHDKIVNYALERLRTKILYTNTIYSILPETFTFAQLQHVYELILSQKLDKRNFRKKYLSLGLIEPTGESLVGQKHRPAALYRFVSSSPTELNAPFIR